jgi:acyl-CoA reductase-like NAD-dependent aldehyde dehydrogenase
MRVTNPYTLESVEVEETKDIQKVYERAARAFKDWSAHSVSERVEILTKALDKLTPRRHELARLISEEMGKPITAAGLEFDRALEECQHSLSNAREFLEPERLPDAEIQFAPLGVVAVIAPWNFPLPGTS